MRPGMLSTAPNSVSSMLVGMTSVVLVQFLQAPIRDMPGG